MDKWSGVLQEPIQVWPLALNPTRPGWFRWAGAYFRPGNHDPILAPSLSFPQTRRRHRSSRKLLIHQHPTFFFSLLLLPQLLLHPPHRRRIVEPILAADRWSGDWNSPRTRHCVDCKIDFRWRKIEQTQTKSSKIYFSPEKRK